MFIEINTKLSHDPVGGRMQIGNEKLGRKKSVFAEFVNKPEKVRPPTGSKNISTSFFYKHMISPGSGMKI